MSVVPRRTKTRPEDLELIAIFDWIDLHPDICDMFFHPINEGKRSFAAGKALKRMGMRSGIPDIVGDIPKGKYHGIRIEHKTKTGKPTPQQIYYIQKYNSLGYYAKITFGVEDAIDTLRWYLSL